MVQAVGLAELDPGSLAAVLDQLSHGADFPMVLVGETVVATGSLDAEAVLAAMS